MSRTRRRNIWVAAETGGYGVDPSADGSGYLAVPTEGLGDITDQLQKLETAFDTGRDWDTAIEAGADGAEIQFSLPLYGMDAAAGDGVAASSNDDDCWDVMLTHCFGSQRVTSGEGVGIGSSGTGLTLDGDAYDVDDPVLIYDTALAGTVDRGQARLIETDAADGTYTVDRAFDGDPTDTAVAYGAKIYRPNAPFVGGDTLSIVYQDDDIGTYRLSGGRVTSFSVADAEVNTRVMANFTVRFDAIAEESATKTALPAVLSAPPTSTIQLRWSPLSFAGTAYDTAKMAFDFGVNAAVVKDTDRANGRAGDEMIKVMPQVSFNPLRAESQRTLMRAVTQGVTMLQIGSGILTSGKMNTFVIVFQSGQITSGAMADDEGHARYEMVIMAKDPGPTAPFVQIARF